jgi:hypothetical protein
MAESLNYPHLDYENTPFLQLNATTSTNIQTQFNNDHRGGAWIRDGGTTTRASAVWYEARIGQYRIVKQSQTGASITRTFSDHATLSAAADAAAAFVDSENTGS